MNEWRLVALVSNTNHMFASNKTWLTKQWSENLAMVECRSKLPHDIFAKQTIRTKYKCGIIRIFMTPTIFFTLS